MQSPKIFASSTPLSMYVRDEILCQERRILPRIILATHQDLMRVVEKVSVPLLVRKQGSSGPCSLRGKTSQISGIERAIVFTDNSPPVWLHEKLLNASRFNCPDIDICDQMEKRLVPVAHSYRREEAGLCPEWPSLGKAMSVYPSNWTAGWKLSHILPCSPQSGDSGDPLRELQTNDPDRFYRVRFLRNMSPFNYFLSPMKSRYVMQIDGKSPRQNDFGEDVSVIEWVVHLLREEVFGNDSGVRIAFDEFLHVAGLDCSFQHKPSEKSITVVNRNLNAEVEEPVNQAANSTVITCHASSSQKKIESHNFAIYQVNQGISKETFFGFLVAPDGSFGGWKLIRELTVGDVVFHKTDGRIRAVSVVEPTDLENECFGSYRQYVNRIIDKRESFLLYEGRHLTMPEYNGTRFLTACIRTVASGLSLDKASGFQGYMVRLKSDRLVERKDLVDLAIAAKSAISEENVS